MNLLSGTEQDFHRPQTSPGGYEWWHFDAIDEKNDLSFVLRFSAGDLFSAYYQDNLKTYWKNAKSPLTSSNPVVHSPRPLDYNGVFFQVFNKGSLIGETVQEFSMAFLKASDQQGAVLLGPNRFNWDTSDPPSYIITVQSPLRGRSVLRARLFFTPLTKALGNLPQPEFPSTHTWVLTAPLCRVEGTLQWCDQAGDVKKEMGFVGQGYHDHHWGTVPLGRFVEGWHWGRAFLGDTTLIYSTQTFTDKKEPPENICLRLEKGELQSIDRNREPQSTRKQHNFFWLPYTKELRQGDWSIQHRSILGNGPVQLTFQDEVTGPGLKRGPGLSGYVFTPRLSDPLFFPMLKGQSTLYSRKTAVDVPSPDPQGGVSIQRPE